MFRRDGNTLGDRSRHSQLFFLWRVIKVSLSALTFWSSSHGPLEPEPRKKCPSLYTAFVFLLCALIFSILLQPYPYRLSGLWGSEFLIYNKIMLEKLCLDWINWGFFFFLSWEKQRSLFLFSQTQPLLVNYYLLKLHYISHTSIYLSWDIYILYIKHFTIRKVIHASIIFKHLLSSDHSKCFKCSWY